jgi:transposase-like protein
MHAKRQCGATTRSGARCKHAAQDDGEFCALHRKTSLEKPKYSAKLEILCRVLARTGNISEACRQANIERQTYYSWFKDGNPEAPRIQAAWDEFAAIDDEAIEAAFRERLLEAIAGPTETWVTEEFVVDEEGNEIGKKITRRTVTRGPAKWALDIAAIQVAGGKFKPTAAGSDQGRADDDNLSNEERARRVREMLGLDPK